MLKCPDMTVNQTTSQPRYRRLAEALQQAIGEGRHAVGSTLPGELELMSRYRVSRHTVREALRCLAELGLISRNRGIGTVVTAREPSSAHVQKLVSPAGWMRYAEDSRLEVIGNEALRADAALARRLECRRGAPWRRVTALRRVTADRVLIGWSDIYLPEAYAGVVGAMGRRAGRVYELIESRFGARVARVEVQVTADLFDARRASALGVPVNSAALCVTRRYRDASGQVLLLSQTHHPAERFTYAFDLLRGGDGSAWLAA